jgi:hypothetical protein
MLYVTERQSATTFPLTYNFGPETAVATVRLPRVLLFWLACHLSISVLMDWRIMRSILPFAPNADQDRSERFGVQHWQRYHQQLYR